MVLLILWAPVWFRSSRLSTTRAPTASAEPGRLGQGRRPADELGQQAIELAQNAGSSRARVIECGQIIQCRDEGFGHIAATIGTKPA